MEKKVGENVKLNLTKVKLAMATKCLSSRGLPEKTKITYPTLVPYLRGAREPKPETLGKIAKALEVDPAELIED